MSIVGKYLARMGFVDRKQLRVQLKRAYNTGVKRGTRAWQAAEVGRLTDSWTVYGKPLESDLITEHPIIRARARERVQNDDIAASYIRDNRENIVGPNGFKFQSNVKEWAVDEAGNINLVPDKLANDRIESAFKDFEKNCSIERTMTLRAIEDLLAIYLVRDGEAFLRIQYRPGAKHGILLQVVEPELIDSYLNYELPNGNVIKMGIEIDPDRGPVNYYVKKSTQASEVFGYTLASWGDWLIIPAATDKPQLDSMLHIYDRQYINATRAVSWMSQSLLRMKWLDQYRGANLTNAIIAADNPYFIIPGAEDSGSGVEDNEEDINADGDREVKAEAGVGQYLDPGDEVTQLKSEFPGSQYEMVITTESHMLSAGMGDSYASLTNDLSNTSFSSGRMGMMKDRRHWKWVQKMIIEQFLDPLFPHFLRGSITAGQLLLPIAKLEKFNKPEWTGETSSWSVNPLQDATARALDIDRGISCVPDEIRKQGNDPEETLRKQAAYIKLVQDIAKEYEIDPNLLLAPMMPKVTPGAATVVENDSADGNADGGQTPPPKTKRSIRGAGVDPLDLAIPLIANEGTGNGSQGKH